MSLTISLPPDAEHTLQERARSAGLDATTYASQLLQNSLRPPRTIQESAAQSISAFSPAAPPMTSSATSSNKPSTICETSGEAAKR